MYMYICIYVYIYTHTNIHTYKPGVGRKGISVERTFRGMSAVAELEAKCRQIVQSLAEDMAECGVKGKTLTLKIKPVTFDTFTRYVVY